MKIDIINTGGTFNKRYNPINGQLEVDSSNRSIEKILHNTYGNIDFELYSIINKDSLYFDDSDRQKLLETIVDCKNDVIVIHGTDTIDQSCQYVDQNVDKIGKKVIFTGSMYPYYLKSDEATFNLATSIAAIKFVKDSDIYIAMHGIIDRYQHLQKDKNRGKFFNILDKQR